MKDLLPHFRPLWLTVPGLLLVVLIAALWMRSLRRIDLYVLTVRDDEEVTLGSGNGGLFYFTARYLDPPAPTASRAGVFVTHPHDAVFAGNAQVFPGIWRIYHQDFRSVSLPYWLVFLLAILSVGGFVLLARRKLRRPPRPDHQP